MVRLAYFISVTILGLLLYLPTIATAQALPSGERYSLFLPEDPFQWEHNLNELGEKGWDGIMAQQPSLNGLTLHIITFVRPPEARQVLYKVIVGQFSSQADVVTLQTTRQQLEVQANSYSQGGWQMIQPLTGIRRGMDQSFIAFVFKRTAK